MMRRSPAKTRGTAERPHPHPRRTLEEPYLISSFAGPGKRRLRHVGMLLEPSQVDGRLTHRYDSTGRPVALLPARCKLGRHTLGHSQFRAVVHDGEAHISCLACATDSVDHSWRLIVTTPVPDSAELSEERYAELVQHRARWVMTAAGAHGGLAGPVGLTRVSGQAPRTAGPPL